MSWTQEREEKLKELWKKGHTASQIAEILGGTTRNAVIGKAHRLKLAARAASKTSRIVKKEASESSNNKDEKFVSRKARFKSLILEEISSKNIFDVSSKVIFFIPISLRDL